MQRTDTTQTTVRGDVAAPTSPRRLRAVLPGTAALAAAGALALAVAGPAAAATNSAIPGAHLARAAASAGALTASASTADTPAQQGAGQPAAIYDVTPSMATQPGKAFPKNVVFQVSDVYGNGIPGVLVHLSMPASGPSGVFDRSGLYTWDQISDEHGYVDVGTVTAGSTPGSFLISTTAPLLGLTGGTLRLYVTSPQAPTQPSMTIGDTSLVEGNSGSQAVEVPVTLNAASSTPVRVHWHTQDDTAFAPSDYRKAAGTLTIPAGQTRGTVTVHVRGDRTPEPNEMFIVALESPSGATLARTGAFVTIVNDD